MCGFPIHTVPKWVYSLYLFFLSFPLLWWDALQWFVFLYSYS